MQASLCAPSASSSTANTTVARSLVLSIYRTPSNSPLKLYERSKWVFNRSVSLHAPSSWHVLRVQRGTPAVVCKAPNITQDNFPDEVLNSELPVLVGFCADWCGPCKLISPVIDSVAKDLNGSLKAVKIDVDTSPDLVKEYDVYGLPTLIVFKDGKEVPNSRKEGAINAKKLKALVEEVLQTTASP